MSFRRSASEIWCSLKADWNAAYTKTEQRKNLAIIGTAAAAVIAADQITKAIATNWKSTILNTSGVSHALKTIVPGFPSQLVVVLSVVSAAALFWLAYAMRMPTLTLGAALLIGCAASNMAEPIFRGGVVDWIPFPSVDGSIAKANIADLAGVAGALLVAAAMVQLNIGVYKNGKKTSHKHKTGCAAENIRIHVQSRSVVS